MIVAEVKSLWPRGVCTKTSFESASQSSSGVQVHSEIYIPAPIQRGADLRAGSRVECCLLLLLAFSDRMVSGLSQKTSKIFRVLSITDREKRRGEDEEDLQTEVAHLAGTLRSLARAWKGSARLGRPKEESQAVIDGVT